MAFPTKVMERLVAFRKGQQELPLLRGIFNDGETKRPFCSCRYVYRSRSVLVSSRHKTALNHATNKHFFVWGKETNCLVSLKIKMTENVLDFLVNLSFLLLPLVIHCTTVVQSTAVERN